CTLNDNLTVPDVTVVSDDYDDLVEGKSSEIPEDKPSESDWASALMIFKTRCGVNNVTMNSVCNMLRLEMSPFYGNVPSS
ncbi:unnamed protein product, partial [Didymodactylos carnosus]